MRLATKNIFLDTNIYDENNFFHSSNIQSLFYYSRIGVINLYMTTISKMELVERMKKRVSEAKEEHNKLVNSVNRSRVLKNLKAYENLEKSQITVDSSIRELSTKLNVIIKSSNINVVSAENVRIEKIFKLYYSKQPPFSQKGKNFEFADAFILESIDSWCSVNKRKMIFVTKDMNFAGVKSPHLIFKNDLPDLLAKISAYYDFKQNNVFIPFIAENLHAHEEEILNLIDAEVDSRIKLELDFENMSSVSRKKVKFNEYKISSIRPEYAEIAYYVEIDFSFTVFPSVNEIERSFFSDSLKPKKFSKKIITACDLNMNLKRKNDIKLKWINSNQKLFVNLEE